MSKIDASQLGRPLTAVEQGVLDDIVADHGDSLLKIALVPHAFAVDGVKGTVTGAMMMFDPNGVVRPSGLWGHTPFTQALYRIGPFEEGVHTFDARMQSAPMHQAFCETAKHALGPGETGMSAAALDPASMLYDDAALVPVLGSDGVAGIYKVPDPRGVDYRVLYLRTSQPGVRAAVEERLQTAFDTGATFKDLCAQEKGASFWKTQQTVSERANQRLAHNVCSRMGCPVMEIDRQPDVRLAGGATAPILQPLHMQTTNLFHQTPAGVVFMCHAFIPSGKTGWVYEGMPGTGLGIVLGAPQAGTSSDVLQLGGMLPTGKGKGFVPTTAGVRLSPTVLPKEYYGLASTAVHHSLYATLDHALVAQSTGSPAVSPSTYLGKLDPPSSEVQAYATEVVDYIQTRFSEGCRTVIASPLLLHLPTQQ